MKKLVLILVLIFTLQQSFSYTWESYGPENIKANKLKLLSSEFPTGIICVDSGMYYVTDFYGQDWQYFTYFNMPVTDVVECNFNSDSILVVMGNGSYSDGIYSFNILTEEFHVIHYCIYPNFIYRFNDYSPYYVGYEDGLLVSQDGLTWNEISFFNGKNCIDIQILYNKMAVATDQPNSNVYWSEDSGDNWETINGEYKISELLLRFNGQLSGICTENSMSCGYYEFHDFSMLWENIFFTEDLNTLGHDNCDRPFLGWHSATGEYEGIAMYFEYVPNNYLTFFNQGLPNLNINNITSTYEYLGGNIVFCCTGGGAFYCMNYVGIDPIVEDQRKIILYPNPVKEKMQISFKSDKPVSEILSMEIYNNRGVKVDEIKFEKNFSKKFEIKWNKGDLPSGVYYLVIKTEKESWSKKFIIL